MELKSNQQSPVLYDDDLKLLYGAIRSQLYELPVQKIRNAVAAAGFDVSRIPSNSERKSGLGSRAEVMPAVDGLFGEMLPQMKLKALQIVTRYIINHNPEQKEKIQEALGVHGFQYLNESFVKIDSRDETTARLTHSTEKQMTSTRATTSKDTSKIFVVHGRNLFARKAIFDFLRSLDLKPVEWDEAIALTGKTAPFIGEGLETAFDEAQAILVLLTGDDLVRLGTAFRENEEGKEALTPQPRPNVLFEAGMAFGRNPNRTILVQLGRIRPFSDIAGRHIVYLDNTPEKRQRLVSRLKTAGCEIDNSHKSDWLSTGDFDSCILWPDKESIEEFGQNELGQMYKFEDIKRQRELLLEFLGKPKSEFWTLQGVGDTWGVDWRRERIRIITDWVEPNRPFFPKHVQRALTSVRNCAGTMLTDDGLKLISTPEGIKATEENFEVIEDYLKQLENELKFNR